MKRLAPGNVQSSMMKPVFRVLAAAAAVTAGACSSSLSGPSGAPDSPVARYRVTFQATWSASSHPIEFPSSAHFSPLVGGTHNTQVTFWRDGAIATDGIKDMAERGLTSTLSAEINAAIAARTAEHVFTGGNIDDSPGSAVAEFEIGRDYPLVTLVSMIAPSPDWFVGVSGVPLLQDGQWMSSRRFDLDPWDAGTDGGVTFLAPDVTLAPRLPITRIVTPPLSPAGRVTSLGSFSFVRVQ